MYGIWRKPLVNSMFSQFVFHGNMAAGPIAERNQGIFIFFPNI